MHHAGTFVSFVGRIRGLAPWFLGALVGCSAGAVSDRKGGPTQPADASTLDDGGAVYSDAQLDPSRDAGADGGAVDQDGSVTEPVVEWPNDESRANSSAWLREHHQSIATLRPRVLVLDVIRGEGAREIGAYTSQLVAAFAEMTRYHGYEDPEAKPFLQYEVDKIVDMKDPGGAEYPDFWPLRGNEGFDVGELFTDEFAPRLGYRDPSDSTRFLPMCELFERGLVNELWIAAGDRNIFENQSRLQNYDEDLEPIAGSFNPCTNGCYYDPLSRVNCKVTVRMQEIGKFRGVGCATHSAGHAFENMLNSNPYLETNATRFFNFDLSGRYGLPAQDQYACPYDGAGNCVDYPSPGTLASGEAWGGEAFLFEDWGEGCGNVHFPPNARFQYDYENQSPALSSCEGYGLSGESDGQDSRSAYTKAKVDAYESIHGDCGGGWQIYLGQSMPGYRNAATAADGKPMLNWWPFLFY